MWNGSLCPMIKIHDNLFLDQNEWGRKESSVKEGVQRKKEN